MLNAWKIVRMIILKWKDFIEQEKNLPYFKNILMYIKNRYANGITIYPPVKDIFNAFRFTEFNKVKVVILGQDPYYGPNQADGLAFSVNRGVPIPPSLKNIYKELTDDIPGFISPQHGCLKSWAKQGILLLNTILTVEEKKARSHSNLGWEIFTDKVIRTLSNKRDGIIFLLWGSYAKKKSSLINHHRHYILTSSHPSPLSANLDFFGCRHFSITNSLLVKQRKPPIDWTLV